MKKATSVKTKSIFLTELLMDALGIHFKVEHKMARTFELSVLKLHWSCHAVNILKRKHFSPLQW
jgi:hemerythrin